MERERLEEIAQRLPIFPLPRTVLLPGSTCPLHVFEPRYRQLVAHCLESDRVFGIATLNEEGPSAIGPSAIPDLHAVVGIGELVAHQPFPDGRSNIAIRYSGRVRLQRELATDTLFRVVQGELLTDDTEGVDHALRALKVLVLQLGGMSTEASEEARRLVQLDGMELADALARRVLTNVHGQLAYVAADRLTDRVDLVQEALARFMGPSMPAGEA